MRTKKDDCIVHIVSAVLTCLIVNLRSERLSDDIETQNESYVEP